jgi:pimeloyl-ACP methyl ester carboxylesterase
LTTRGGDCDLHIARTSPSVFSATPEVGKVQSGPHSGRRTISNSLIFVQFGSAICYILFANCPHLLKSRNSMSSLRFYLQPAPVNIGGSKQVDTRSRERVLVLFIALALIWLSLSGCVPIGPTYAGGRNNILHDDREYKLAAIEFGELGSYADPYKRELNNTIQLLKNTERPLLVVYIHGWLNNATSGDVGNFKGFLSRLSQSKQVRIHHYNVFGVYFAWPGKSIDFPYLQYLTFWNRKQAAERIASNGDCLDAIEQLSQMARTRENNYVFLIGHSFGGLILERTVEHTLRTLQGQKVRPPWDLAVMLNPASDSVLTRQLVSDLDDLYRYDPTPIPGNPLHWGGHFVAKSGGDPIAESQPTVVELQSENDTATGTVFPIGSKAGVIVNGHWAWNQVPVPRTQKLVPESDFYLSTPGNDSYLVNYEIIRSTKKFPGDADAFDYNLENNPVGGVFFTSAPKNSQTAAEAGKQSRQAESAPKTQPQAWQIQFVGDHDKYIGVHVPFWIVRVPSDIIDNHGGIWSDNNMALMAAIFRMHRPILANNVIAPAKSYVLPSPVTLKQPSR